MTPDRSLTRNACPRRWLLGVLTCMLSGAAQAIDWPQEIAAEEGTIVVYQPQPETLEANELTGRAAMSLELKGQPEPIFGAFWFTARIDTDTETGTAIIRDLRITNVRWPDSTDAAEQRFTSVVEANVPATGFAISLERLAASLEEAEIEQKSLTELKSDPPEIRFADALSVLLLYDGEPRFSPVEDTDYERALNTPFLVVRNRTSGESTLSSGTLWYVADNPLGPWSAVASPPQDLQQLLPPPPEDAATPDTPPAVVVATRPTELVVTDGPPDWQSLMGGALLYVTNTETPWLRELATGNMYLLLSGRWYRAKAQAGPWTFVPADELPASFQDIAPASDIGGLRVSVAGTEEAEDALLDAQIPQTAAIRRDEASLDVTYDGRPKFEKIPGTAVSYAVNTGAQVLEINGRYYAVDDGVWFTAAKADGPWAVADTIPDAEIQKIPPSAPVYNTTYVRVYESTPDIVYVGYTPGYLWSFPYYGVPVYGTGWHYPPYWGSWYYPRPPTWGLHVGYNPWTGWNYGFSWSNGFFSFGMSWGGGWGGAYRPWGCCSGWYGGGYRRPVVINTGNINIGNNINVGNRAEIAANLDKRNINVDRSRRNLYNRPENRTRNAAPEVARKNLKQARPSGNRANNVYADRNGNVARRVDDQWERRADGAWRSEKPVSRHEPQSQPAKPARPTTPQTSDRATISGPSRDIDRSGLNRAHQARARGTSREQARSRATGLRQRR